jgi:hypothetical protein
VQIAPGIFAKPAHNKKANKLSHIIVVTSIVKKLTILVIAAVV